MERMQPDGDHMNGEGPTDDEAERDLQRGQINDAGCLLLVALALVVRLLVGEFFGV